MKVKQQMLRREFEQKVYSLDLKGLKTLFEQLQADSETPVGLLFWLSKVYAEKARQQQ